MAKRSIHADQILPAASAMINMIHHVIPLFLCEEDEATARFSAVKGEQAFKADFSGLFTTTPVPPTPFPS
jgi:hypothetical protein